MSSEESENLSEMILEMMIDDASKHKIITTLTEE